MSDTSASIGFRRTGEFQFGTPLQTAIIAGIIVGTSIAMYNFVVNKKDIIEVLKLFIGLSIFVAIIVYFFQFLNRKLKYKK